MKEFMSKLKSRKFIAAAAGFITGIAMIFGLDEAVINTVAGAVVSAGSIVTYIVTEGRIDAEAAVKAAHDVIEAGEMLK